jgi:hypothetical protein
MMIRPARLRDAALPPGWTQGPGGAPVFTAYSSQLLKIQDGTGAYVLIPQGDNAANWTAAQNAVNAGTSTLAQIATQYGTSVTPNPYATAPPAIAPPAKAPTYGTGEGIAAPPYTAPVQVPAAPPAPPTLPSPAYTGEPYYPPAAGGFSLTSPSTWPWYVWAGVAAFALFSFGGGTNSRKH